MVIAATNDGPAFVKCSSLNGGGDPFDLPDTMREFRMLHGSSKTGGARMIELSLVAPSAAAENKVLSYLGKPPEENFYKFTFGWEGGGKSDPVHAEFLDCLYSINLGNEITMKLKFGVNDNHIKNQLSGKKAKRTRTVAAEEPKEGLGKAIGKLIAKIC